MKTKILAVVAALLIPAFANAAVPSGFIVWRNGDSPKELAPVIAKAEAETAAYCSEAYGKAGCPVDAYRLVYDNALHAEGARLVPTPLPPDIDTSAFERG